MLCRDDVVVEGKDGVLGAVDEERPRAAGFVQRPVVEQRVFLRGLGLELVEVVAVAVFEGERLPETGGQLCQPLIGSRVASLLAKRRERQRTRTDTPRDWIRPATPCQTCDDIHHPARPRP